MSCASGSTKHPASTTKDGPRLMKKPLVFASSCPGCGQQRFQHGYARHALVGLIQSGQIIDAYCLECDLVWPISVEERDLIVQAIAVGHTNAPPRAEARGPPVTCRAAR